MVEKKNKLLVIGLCVQVVALILMRSGMYNPYRQLNDINQNSHRLEISSSGSDLVLEEGFATYIASAKKLAIESGFEPRTPIIDLTGQSPGILYAMQGRILGRPWIGGGYEGSDIWAISLLSVENCSDLSNAWILAEPNGPRSLSSEVLLSFGSTLSKDYTLAGVLETARGAGGFKERRRQLLYKPKRSAMHAENMCRLQKPNIAGY